MKKVLTLASFLFWLITSISAQDIPNPGFEEWDNNASNQPEPVSWQTNNITDLTFVYQEAGHSGQYSASISVQWDESLNMNITPVLFMDGYYPVSERFTSLKFYFIGETLNEDYLMVTVGMKKNGINIASTLYPFYDDHFDWTQVTVPIEYFTGDIPDECYVAFTIWPAGECDLGSYCILDDLEFSTGSGPVPPILVDAITNVAGTAFELHFNTPMADPSGTHDQFSGTHNGAAVSFTDASLKAGNNGTIVLSLANPVVSNEVLKVSYNAGTVNSAEGVALGSFSNEDVTNLVSGGVQGSWHQVPSGTEENLYCVHFANNSTGYVSGTNGKVLKSINGGFNWTPQAISAQWDLMTIWATTPENVHIGSWDTIYNTTNGGQSWSGVYLNTVNFWVLDLQFHTQNLGYMFLQASAFKKTTDGGNTWSDLTGSGVIDDFLAGYMIDETNGFAVGGAGLMTHTTDGGQTWPQYEWNGWTEWSPLDIEGVHFTSMMNGFAVADSGVLFRTTNGGEHWTKQYIAGPEDRLKDIFFLNANLGWIVGYHGTIFSTTNGGETWNLESAITPNDLNSVHFTSPNTGWAVGTNGTILRFGDPSSSIFDQGEEEQIPFEIYPNPASSYANINLSLTETTQVSFGIYDLSGRKIACVYEGTIDKGSHILSVDLPQLPAGMYFCRLSSSSGTSARNMMICH